MVVVYYLIFAKVVFFVWPILKMGLVVFLGM